MVAMFEDAKDEQRPGLTGGGINENLKNTRDLSVTYLAMKCPRWASLDTMLCQRLSKGINTYAEHLSQQDFMGFQMNNITDSGYHIQKYDSGKGFYKWHHDYRKHLLKGTERVITFIWYLNDITEGGETEFVGGTRITPTRGSLLLFPSYWTFYHCGNIPISSDKYICTGWLEVPHTSFINDGEKNIS